MASTVLNGNDRSEKWQRPFQMATTFYEREICVGSAVKQLAETTGHDIDPNYAIILETGVKTKDKRVFLESLHFIPCEFSVLSTRISKNVGRQT